ncbi:MAG: hypothetical protein JO092_10180, partial [Candidatus Eremiobacteraeota bacterium]|nr:hypothetical protein [Candidatus Eremiobacteraeota bacterium]
MRRLFFAKVEPWPVCVLGLYLALNAVYAVLGLWRYAIFRAGDDAGAFTPHASPTVADRSDLPCRVSYDGVIYYRVPAGAFPPIDVRLAGCGRQHLGRNATPPYPHWATPSGPTQTRFIATSLQQAISIEGMRIIERTAAAHHVPVTWMVGHPRYLEEDAADYNAFHARNGDDAQTEFYPSYHAIMEKKLAWYRPTVSVLTAGAERDIARAISFGEYAFWGITWNSRGTDGTWDYGAPWGTY